MPQAIADPEEIEAFARELRRFDETLSNSVGRLQGRFNRLGETWRDQEHAKFAQEFQRTVQQLRRFHQITEEQIPVLTRKARKLRDYLHS